MTPTATTAGLLAAVLDAPRDDFLRLLLADALEEQGDTERAEFVRLQMSLPRVIRESMCHHDLTMPQSCPACRLRRRERALLDKTRNWSGWAHQAFDELAYDIGVATSGKDEVVRLYNQAKDQTGEFRIVYRRGLIEEIALTLADFMAHARAIFSAAPVLRVTLTDREPTQFRAVSNGGFWRWFDGSRGVWPASDDPDELPGPLWQAYHEVTEQAAITWDHPTREHAIAYLLHACVRFGRQVAGLPSLTP